MLSTFNFQLTGTTFTEYLVIFGSWTFPSLPACIRRIFTLQSMRGLKHVRYRKCKKRELYLLWAVEYLNERIFTLLASYAESRILGALNLKQSKQQQQQQSLDGFENFPSNVPFYMCWGTHTHKLDVGIKLSSSFLKHPIKMWCVVTSAL